MTASKNCPCPVCKDNGLVQNDSSRWYFICSKCRTIIGQMGVEILTRSEAGLCQTFLRVIGKWRTAKEAIKAIKEYKK